MVQDEYYIKTQKSRGRKTKEKRIKNNRKETQKMEGQQK